MICRIAGARVEISPEYEYLRSAVSVFEDLSETPADFSINISEREIAYIRSRNPQLSCAVAESIAAAEFFARKIPICGGIVLHASAIEYKGRGILFSADSQVGKSTQRKLWCEHFGAENIKILNDDKPVIRSVGGEIKVCGTPFSGGSGLFLNAEVPVSAIFFLKRGTQNRARRLDGAQTAQHFLSNTVKYVGREHMLVLLDLIDKLVKKVKIFELECTPTDEAVACAVLALEEEIS